MILPDKGSKCCGFSRLGLAKGPNAAAKRPKAKAICPTIARGLHLLCNVNRIRRRGSARGQKRGLGHLEENQFIDGHFKNGHFIDRTFHRQDISKTEQAFFRDNLRFWVSKKCETV